MSLPLSIFGALPVSSCAWQPEEARELVAAANHDLQAHDYAACRQKCITALSYGSISLDTRVAACITLGLAQDDASRVRIARLRAAGLYDRAVAMYANRSVSPDHDWLATTQTALSELWQYEQLLKADSDHGRDAGQAEVKKGADHDSKHSALASSTRCVDRLCKSTASFRADAIARLTHASLQSSAGVRHLIAEEAEVDADPVLLRSGIGSMVRWSDGA